MPSHSALTLPAQRPIELLSDSPPSHGVLGGRALSPVRKVLDTRDRDCAEHTVARMFCNHRLTPQGDAPLQAMMQVQDSGNLQLSVLQYGDTVTIEPGALEKFYLLQVPLQGQAQISHGGETFVSDQDTASLLSPQAAVAMQWQADNRQLCLRIDVAKMQRFLHAWLGHKPARLPQFQGRIAWPEHPALWNFVQGVKNGQASKQSEYALISLLLSTVAHDCSALLHSTTPPLAPRSVRLVEDYIVQHCDEALSPEQLAAIVHVSVRSLYLGFQRYRGISPMRYLHEVRLQKARLDLLCAAPKTQISTVAQRWQLPHLGRFACDYRRLFGETPKQTLSRQR